MCSVRDRRIVICVWRGVGAPYFRASPGYVLCEGKPPPVIQSKSCKFQGTCDVFVSGSFFEIRTKYLSRSEENKGVVVLRTWVIAKDCV